MIPPEAAPSARSLCQQRGLVVGAGQWVVQQTYVVIRFNSGTQMVPVLSLTLSEAVGQWWEVTGVVAGVQRALATKTVADGSNILNTVGQFKLGQRNVAACRCLANQSKERGRLQVSCNRRFSVSCDPRFCNPVLTHTYSLPVCPHQT